MERKHSVLGLGVCGDRQKVRHYRVQSIARATGASALHTETTRGVCSRALDLGLCMSAFALGWSSFADAVSGAGHLSCRFPLAFPIARRCALAHLSKMTPKTSSTSPASPLPVIFPSDSAAARRLSAATTTSTLGSPSADRVT